MSLGRAVPWASWGEWRQVGLWLLSEAPQEVQRGLDRVAAWRTRGRVPLGVDSTACFVETQQRDRAAAAAAACSAPPPLAPGPAASESELRLQYGLAIVRMVNGIADSSQRGRVAASVASLASAAGLPRILVDLRHEATHNELPSLATLRLATHHGLVWLQFNYWQRQSDHLEASTAKVQSMVREYLLLHQAAAAKVAASAAAAVADSDDESGDEEEGGRHSAAAAAVAAAATLSVGRRAASRQDKAAAPATSAGGSSSGTALTLGGAAASGYQAANAKKRRRLLLAELRSAVPRPAAALLAGAVLAASAPLAAGSAPAETDAEAEQQGGQAAKAASSGARGTAGEVVAERALAAAMAPLCCHWPQLPPLLLLAAVHQLVAAAEAGPHRRQAPPALAPALTWLRRLLPAPASASQQPGASTGSLLAACGSWKPSAVLLQHLLAAVLPAHAATASQAACDALQLPGGSGGWNGAISTSAVAEALQQAVSLLVAAARASPGSTAAVVAASSLVSLEPPARVTLAGGAAPAVPGDANTLAQLTAAASQQQVLLQQLQQQWELRQRQAGAVAGSKRPAGVGQGAVAASGRKRWRRAASWHPCALGMLPCAADVNGRLPPLEAPPPLQLPVGFEKQQAAAMAEADAAVAGDGGARRGGCSPQQAAQLAQEGAMLPGAAATLDAAGPWPAADRFVASVVAGGDEEQAMAGEQEQAASAGGALRFALPAVCSALL